MRARSHSQHDQLGAGAAVEMVVVHTGVDVAVKIHGCRCDSVIRILTKCGGEFRGGSDERIVISPPRRRCHDLILLEPLAGTQNTQGREAGRARQNRDYTLNLNSTLYRALGALGCEPRSSDGNPPAQQVDQADSSDQAVQGSSR